jgi:hypothetical protein
MLAENSRACLIVSSGLWLSQGPGAESVGGVSLAFFPGQQRWEVTSSWLPEPKLPYAGYTVVLLGLLTHPVDTRPSSMERALELAMQGLPEARGALISDPPPSVVELDWMWRPQPLEFETQVHIWSRVCRYQPAWEVGAEGRLGALPRTFETLLEWQPGQLVRQSECQQRDHLIACFQAQLAHQAWIDSGR